MKIELNDEQVRALTVLKKGLHFHDHFGPAADDKQIYVTKGDTLYEFASLTDDLVLRLGHLRAIASILGQSV